MTDLPASVRYVKNGAGGRWWPDAKSRSRLHAGWSRLPDEMLRAADVPAIEAVLRERYGSKPGATQDLNALRSLIEEPSRHLWVTFEDGFMWWSTVRDGITVSPDNETAEHGHFWLDLDRPWDNRSLAGRYLAVSELPGIVTTTAGFKGTICEPKGMARDPALGPRRGRRGRGRRHGGPARLPGGGRQARRQAGTQGFRGARRSRPVSIRMDADRETRRGDGGPRRRGGETVSVHRNKLAFRASRGKYVVRREVGLFALRPPT